MISKYKIIYTMRSRKYMIELEASSKYDAKQRFYRLFPKAEIVKVERSGEDA